MREANIDDNASVATRRPIAARQSSLARGLTRSLLKTSITPNQISLLSVVCAAVGSLALLFAPERPWLFLVALIGIQLWLLCNLLDGMVAIEGERGSPLGVLYNEFPDRVADSVLIVCLGYAAEIPSSGWAAALAAALTAYVRVFGGAIGQLQGFRGPMAKQHRMALMSIACVLALVEASLTPQRFVLTGAAWLLLIGSLATCATRASTIAQQLADGGSKP